MAPQLEMKRITSSHINSSPSLELIYLHADFICSHTQSVFLLYWLQAAFVIHIEGRNLKHTFHNQIDMALISCDIKHHMNLKHFCLSCGILVLKSIESALNWVLSSGVYPNTCVKNFIHLCLS